MAFVTEPVYRLSVAAKAVGGLNLCFAAGLCAMLAIVADAVPRTSVLLGLLAIVAFYGVLGSALVYCGIRLADGRAWAFTAMTVLAGVIVLKICFDLFIAVAGLGTGDDIGGRAGGLVCYGLMHVPQLAFLVLFWIAWPEGCRMRRSERIERLSQQRGFDPVIKVPPPPAAGRPAASRPPTGSTRA